MKSDLLKSWRLFNFLSSLLMSMPRPQKIYRRIVEDIDCRLHLRRATSRNRRRRRPECVAELPASWRHRRRPYDRRPEVLRTETAADDQLPRCSADLAPATTTRQHCIRWAQTYCSWTQTVQQTMYNTWLKRRRCNTWAPASSSQSASSQRHGCIVDPVLHRRFFAHG